MYVGKKIKQKLRFVLFTLNQNLHVSVKVAFLLA